MLDRASRELNAEPDRARVGGCRSDECPHQRRRGTADAYRSTRSRGWHRPRERRRTRRAGNRYSGTPRGASARRSGVPVAARPGATSNRPVDLLTLVSRDRRPTRRGADERRPRGVDCHQQSVPELIGASAAMSEVRRAIGRAARAPFSVMIEGESGVGKELAARAIHHLSPRRERRFCDVNCAALPDELLESELFGHAKGAFTGAVADKAGLFEEADGGTLFLDEVPDLSPRAQAKLLRVGAAAGGAPHRRNVHAQGGRTAGGGRQSRHARRGGGQAVSRRTCCSGSTSSTSVFRRCASGRRTSRCWRSITGAWRRSASGRAPR